MTNDKGTHGDKDRGLTITIGAPFVEEHGQAGALAYARTISAIAQAHRDGEQDDIAKALKKQLGDQNFAIPEIELKRLAEQLQGISGELTVVNPDGVALVGDQALALNGQAHKDETEDPEDSDRPTFS